MGSACYRHKQSMDFNFQERAQRDGNANRFPSIMF